MTTCKHKNTIVNSTDVAYWIECLKCHKQWDEAEYTDMREAHCRKCGDGIKGDEDSMCGNCV